MPPNDEATLSCFVIYDHPRDYPDHFVVRRWYVEDWSEMPVPAADAVLADTLESARAAVPPGLVNLGNFLEADPSILEVWF